MIPKENARFNAGALKAWRHFGADNITTRNLSQREPRAPRFAPTARGMLRELSTAARDGRLTRWEAGFVASLQHQAASRRWRPSQRQAAVIRRLHAALAEAEATLIDDHDTVDACAATGGWATEFVSP